jgi:hypothetical protein
MKKLLILSIGLLLLAGCEKECGVCTVTRTHSQNGETTETHNQSDDGDCDISLSEYEEGIDGIADTQDLYIELTSVGVTVSHTISCQ